MGIESRDRFASQGSRPCAVFRIFAVGLYPVSASSDVVVSSVVRRPRRGNPGSFGVLNHRMMDPTKLKTSDRMP
jgi:hypothetical protein